MTQAPSCPGCHIGCSLAKPQCGRGLKFMDMLERGEEIPVRRMPGGPGGPGHGGHGGPEHGGKGERPAPNPRMRDNHLTMLLTKIMPHVLADASDPESDDQASILAWIERQEGKLSKAIMPERARVDKEALDANLSTLLDAGLVETVELNGTVFYTATESGKAQAQEREDAKQAATAKALESLSDDEREMLVQLCHKIMEANRPKGAPGRPGPGGPRG